MRTLRLALLTVATGMLMAPGLGNVPVGDGSATQPIGDVGVGDRFGGCPAIPGSPYMHFAARLETAYADTDPVGTMTDQGSAGNNATQAVGSKQPTFIADCLGGQACFDTDAGDIMTSTFGLSQDFQICMVYQLDLAGVDYLLDGDASNTVGAFRAGGAGNFTFASDSGNIATQPPTYGSFDFSCTTWDGTSSAATVNGSDYASSMATNTAATLTYYSTQAESLQWNGKLAEFIVYDSPQAYADVDAAVDCIYGGGGWPK